MQLTQEQVLNLSGGELDIAVALARGWQARHSVEFGHSIYFNQNAEMIMSVFNYHPSTNGSQCMEIMQCYRIGVNFNTNGAIAWMSDKGIVGGTIAGETVMIAICRCFVLSKLDMIK